VADLAVLKAGRARWGAPPALARAQVKSWIDRGLAAFCLRSFGYETLPDFIHWLFMLQRPCSTQETGITVLLWPPALRTRPHRPGSAGVAIAATREGEMRLFVPVTGADGTETRLVCLGPRA